MWATPTKLSSVPLNTGTRLWWEVASCSTTSSQSSSRSMASISARGTITSSTVPCSSSKTRSNISLCESSSFPPDSVTATRSSSFDSAPLCTITCTPNRRKNPLEKNLTAQTKGARSNCRNASTQAAGKAISSGWIAAKVLGATSANTSTTNTNASGA